MLKEASTFCSGDIVFAKKPGYIPWPACLLEYRKKHKVWYVQFLATNDRSAIGPSKLWLFETHRDRFATEQNLSYADFKNSVQIGQSLLQASNTSSPPPSPSKAAALATTSTARQTSPYLTRDQVIAFELNFVRALQKQRPTLEFEKRFVSLINEIRQNLICTSTNMPAALEALNQLMEQPISQYMLVRNFECVNAIRKLRNYVGNIWHIEPKSKELRELACEATLVRLKATDVYDFFKTLFPIHYTHDNFWLEYCNQHSIYRKYTVPVAIK